MIQPQQTLSVVLTVHNAEKTLANQVTKTLDILTDLSARFELLIVDDGSTDQTEEVAHELARHFPQLRVARHARRLGGDAAAKTALERTTGDVVVLHEAETPMPSNELRRVWELGQEGRKARLVPSPRRLVQRSSEPLVPQPLPIAGRGPHGDRSTTAFPRLLPRIIAQLSPASPAEAPLV